MGDFTISTGDRRSSINRMLKPESGNIATCISQIAQSTPCTASGSWVLLRQHYRRPSVEASPPLRISTTNDDDDDDDDDDENNEYIYI